MSLQNLRSKTGRYKSKRVGRGIGSGRGVFSGRGCKGQLSRSGGRRHPGFEGGQTPFIRRMPKSKGFTNPNYVEYQTLNVDDLNVFENGAEVTAKELREKRLIGSVHRPIKLLGDGNLEKSLTITVNKASKSAIAKIESSKGKVKLLTKEQNA